MQQTSNWMRCTWRPLMAIIYAIIIVFDFILFPIMWSFFQVAFDINPITVWTPISLQSSAFLHITMMTILGISAWTRGQEKIETLKTNGKQ